MGLSEARNKTTARRALLVAGLIMTLMWALAPAQEAARDREPLALQKIMKDLGVQLSCFGCHQAFRQPFVEHFYAEGDE